MKGPRVTSPTLARLEGLIGLSRRHGVDINPTLLRVLTDLYVQKPVHSPEEESQFTTLALRLIDVVDVDTRDIVGRKLAAYAGAPAPVLKRLSGEVAEPDMSNQPHAAAQTIEPEKAAGQTPPVQTPPAGPAPPRYVRTSAAAPELTSLFFAADATERRMILANLHYADVAAFKRRLPGDVEKSIRDLEASVLAGRIGEFVRVLEQALGTSRAIAERIVNDTSGEPIVVAAKALGMPLPVLQRILLFVNPAVGHSVRRVYELSALYDEISLDSACHLASLWRDPRPGRPPAAHHPVSFDDDRRRLRDAGASGGERLGTIEDDDDIFLDRVQRTK